MTESLPRDELQRHWDISTNTKMRTKGIKLRIQTAVKGERQVED